MNRPVHPAARRGCIYLVLAALVCLSPCAAAQQPLEGSAPPWHSTQSAYAGYVVVAGLLLAGVYRATHQAQQQSLRLQAVVRHQALLRAEKESIQRANTRLEHELVHKNQALASSAMHIVHSQETIQKLKKELATVVETIQEPGAKAHLKTILKSIAGETKLENRWKQVEHHLNQLHQDFLVRLRNEYPGLTHTDIKLISYLKLNMASKEIAPLLNLSVRGVEASRYRIRKKMNLSPEVNLTDFILRY